MMTEKELTYEEWLEEGKSLFGDDMAVWRFVCPACGYIAEAKDWKRLGAELSVAVSCVGRFTRNSPGIFLENKKQPCNYSGNGLIRLNPIKIKFPGGREGFYFDFDRLDTRALNQRF